MKKYQVTLTAEERQQLQGLIATSKAAAKKLTHVRILLKADTVARVRQRFVEQGRPAALTRKKQDRPSRERKLDGQAEARVIALACSAPPKGRKECTIQLLADRLVEREVVDSICEETVHRVLKKTNSSRG